MINNYSYDSEIERGGRRVVGGGGRGGEKMVYEWERESRLIDWLSDRQKNWQK